MRNNKHTQGPWLIETMGPNMFKIEAETQPICRLHDFNDNGEANARLIAAAPDMLAALESALKNLKSLDVACPVLIGEIDQIEQSIQYTIDKARGES